jgi:hypothetical protein
MAIEREWQTVYNRFDESLLRFTLSGSSFNFSRQTYDVSRAAGKANRCAPRAKSVARRFDQTSLVSPHSSRRSNATISAPLSAGKTKRRDVLSSVSIVAKQKRILFSDQNEFADSAERSHAATRRYREGRIVGAAFSIEHAHRIFVLPTVTYARKASVDRFVGRAGDATDELFGFERAQQSATNV